MEAQRPDDSKEMERVLRQLARLERLLQAGASMEEALAKVEFGREEMEAYVDQYMRPQNGGPFVSASNVFRAVVPIFRDAANNATEHIGSGVIVEIGNELFVISAAHVFDETLQRNLYIPAVNNIEAMEGAVAHGVMPSTGQRKDDRVDLAYFHLSSTWREKLHPSFAKVSVDDLQLTDIAQTGNIHTFAGWPWRKVSRQGHTYSGEQTSYTGHLLPPDIYQRLGYSRVGHILIRMRRKRTDSTLHGPGSPAPHPAGISGGAVIAWPPTIQERSDSPHLKLAGIAHTYHEREHCMAATRVIAIVMAIVRNNPHLAKHFDCVRDMVDELRTFFSEFRPKPKTKIDAVGIAWYTKGSYQYCLRVFDDGSELPETFHEWKRLAHTHEATLLAQGMKVIRVKIDPATFPHWCKANGFARIDKDARMAFGNLKAMESITEGGG